MTSPLVDPQQREKFLEVAKSVGYKTTEFGFVHSTTTDKVGLLVHEVKIARGNWRRSYLHGGQIRWFDDALKDLYAGHFGAPLAG